ncbi:glycosyl transferase [Macrococcoides caseolyticum]|nr:sugar transferase [Macrococcus caseolyticus]PKE07886.1 glycosyl transferase [Macrococcus caseolyticus]PKE24884.1 glycosyl transferase [Macrococcus caseolyticus]PKE54540.1 glycosyl transferase [Macrococcus caseolyticus]PKF39405.1 glycosyl transferase [Macrococcus caseolyticus]
MNIFGKVSKRALDITASAAALVVIAPVIAYAAYKIKKEDNGPVFFKQKRSGLNDEPFDIYKLRSMKVNNNSVKKENPYKAWNGHVPDDFVFKTTSDSNPNITNFGKIIRKYSLDELPQFYNVLKGEMSIVGPRPELIEITEQYDDNQRQRLNVKPGITGWAQVNGRSDMNHGDKIKHDLYYLENQTLMLDLKIIWLTFWQVIAGKGSA